MIRSPRPSPNTSVLLTGAAGFMGCHLPKRLLSADAQAAILDDLHHSYSPEIKQENLRQAARQAAFEFIRSDDGRSPRDDTYVDDIADGIPAALSLKARFEVFNLGNGHPISLKPMTGLLEKTLGRKARQLNQDGQPSDLAFTHAGPDKASRISGYAPQATFPNGCRTALSAQISFC